MKEKDNLDGWSSQDTHKYKYICPFKVSFQFFLTELLKTRQQAQNGVAYAKPHITNLRLNLIASSALPEMESESSQSGIISSALLVR